MQIYIYKTNVPFVLLQVRFPNASLKKMIDAKSIKNADTAEEKGYDAHKKVSGIKLPIITNAMGPTHALSVSRANITDREGTVKMASSHIKLFFV